jgi:hypothetical protein
MKNQIAISLPTAKSLAYKQIHGELLGTGPITNNKVERNIIPSHLYHFRNPPKDQPAEFPLTQL